jgi:REP element-mobilizing transposase RayT
MPQSLAKIYTHLVFSTKHRECWLTDDLRADLHAYLGGTLNGMGCTPIEINSEPEHVHVLFLLSRTLALSEVISNLKTASNDWLRAKGPSFSKFHWQAGYGAFSVSQSGAEEVRCGTTSAINVSTTSRCRFRMNFGPFCAAMKWNLRNAMCGIEPLAPIQGAVRSDHESQGIGLIASALG